MKISINQLDQELSEKDAKIKELQQQLKQESPSTNKISLDSQTEKVGIMF